MMVFLPADTWIRLLIWMAIGFDVYIAYGLKNSKLQAQLPSRTDQLVLRASGVIISILLVFVALWYQQTIGWAGSKILMTIAIVVVLIHSLFTWYRLKDLRSLEDKEIIELA